jgi:hypothetical protein
MPTEVASVGEVGEQNLASGTGGPFRQGYLGDQIVSELHGRFYETNYRGHLFSDGMGLTAINNATYTTGTLTASVTPIAGLYNPSGSGFNCVLVECTLGLTMTALAATGGGPYVWATSVGNAAISTGNTPLSRKSLVAGGSVARGLANVAPTGLTNNYTVRFASSLFGGSAENASFTATAVAMQTQQQSAKELFDGSIIVPPGGTIILLATTTPVAHSAVSSLVWEEVPV